MSPKSLWINKIDNEYTAGAVAALPLAAAIALPGVLFGYLATAAGLSPIAAVVMSGTTFSGSAQFAAIAVLGTGGTVAAAVTAVVLLNSRYAIMGLTLASTLPGGRVSRGLLAQLAIDESWAVAYQNQGRFVWQRLVGAGAVLLAVHVSMTAVGTMAGQVLHDPGSLGLDAALPALFVILLAPLVRRREGLVAALLGAGIALVLMPIAPPGIPLLAASAAGFYAPRPS